MSDWIKIISSIIGSAIGAAFLVWNLLQAHESRLNIMDVRMASQKEIIDTHIKIHETQYESIASKLTEIQVDIGRIQGSRGSIQK